MAGNPREQRLISFEQSLTEQQRVEILATPHGQLLHEAFDALTTQLDRDSYTGRFNHLRHVHSRKLLQYWAALKAEYEARATGNGDEIILGDRRISGVLTERYEDEEDKVFHLSSRTPMEEAQFSMTVSTFTGLDEFMFPPTIESKILFAPGEEAEFYYKVVFRNQIISTLTRTQVRPAIGALAETNLYMKDTREIDCSIFGTEIPRTF